MIEIPIAHFCERYAGERCGLLANGPSLVDHADELASAPYMLIGINRSWEFLRTPYLCIVDRHQYPLLAGSGVHIPHLFVAARKTEYWQECKATSYTSIPNAGDKRRPFWCWDLTQGAFQPSTALFALQIAVWMGFTRIDIFGLDLCERDGRGHFYDGRPMDANMAKRQNMHLGHAAKELAGSGVRVVVRNPASKCTAFEKGVA